ncbi:MAG: squalene/phytoene synthase family protein, partial [Methyloligellaceae bacterium]
LSARVVAGTPLSPDDAAREAGFAYGLTGLLRAVPLHAASGRLYLPATHLRDHGVEPARLLAGQADDGLAGALASLHADIRRALARAQEALASQADAPLPGFLPLTLVPSYLRALERPGHKVLKEVADISPLRRLGRLTWAALRGRI